MFGKIDWGKLGGDVGKQAVPFVMGLMNGLVSGIMDEAIHHPLDLALFIASLIPIGRAAVIIGKVLEHIPFVRALAPLLHGLEAAGKAVEKPVFGLLKKIAAPFGKLVDLIAAPFKRVGVFLLHEGEEALFSLARGFGIGWRTAQSWLRGVARRALSAVGKLARILFAPVIDLIKGLIAGFQGKWGTAASLFKGIPKKILAFFAGAAKLLYGSGIAIIRGLLSAGWRTGSPAWLAG